jgi:hypothetical protein
MSISKGMYFEHQTFEAGVLAKALADVVYEFGDGTPPRSLDLSEALPDGTDSRHAVAWNDLETICDLRDRVVRLMFTDRGDRLIYIIIGGHASRLGIDIDCDNPLLLSGISRRLVNSLRLKEAPREPSTKERLAQLESRLSALEKAVLGRERPLRCFLSYRFVPEDEIIALKVQQFLALLDVEVLSGASYEPKRVSEKVLSRLTESLDFVVVLVLRDGESMWTRDEITTASSQGLAVVPLVEKGARFSPGLFGDLEHVSFEPGHIGDAFLKLLEAVRFLRRERLGLRMQPKPTEGSGVAGPIPAQ